MKMTRIGGGNLGATLLLAVVASAAWGCGSNSNEVGTSVCQKAPASASDPYTAAALSAVEGHHNLEGTWLNGREASVLEFDFTAGEVLPGSGTGCGESLLLAVDVRVKTRDGVLNARGSVARFQQPLDGAVEVPLPDLADAYARPDPALPPIAEGPGAFPVPGAASSPAPTLLLAFGATGLAADVVVDRTRVVGRWSSDVIFVPSRRAVPYVVPPELVADCAPAADFTDATGQYTAFAGATDAQAAMPGNWILCRAVSAGAQAGLQISPDGSWRTLAWRDGAFVTQGGFQKEGIVEPAIDTSAFNGPGFYQVNLRGPAIWRSTHLWGDRLIVSGGDKESEIGGQSVYVRTDRVAAAVANPYVSGQRAGAAACAMPETGTIDPEVGSEMESTLAGEWTLCTGELLDGHRTLRFDGQGAVTALGADGASLGTRTYKAIQPITQPVVTPRNTALVFADDTVWNVMFSERPLKLWMVESGRHTVDRVAVFSPVP